MKPIRIEIDVFPYNDGWVAECANILNFQRYDKTIIEAVYRAAMMAAIAVKNGGKYGSEGGFEG